MKSSPYAAMQAAVDIVGTSPHPSNKIAATLVCADGAIISRTNAWPAAIASALGTEVRIGNSSGTIHAETACILASGHATHGASLFVTDPPCPNCVKNMAEAGIAALYIDHKGFEKDFARRRRADFEDMSLKIAEKAGIEVHILYRKDQRIETLQERASNYAPPAETLIFMDEPSHPLTTTGEKNNTPFASARLTDANGRSFIMTALRGPVCGQNEIEPAENPESKYSFVMEPVNRLIMRAARDGLSIDPASLYSSRVPTSRELINMIGAGLVNLQIGDLNAHRDEHGPAALETLKASGILNLQH